MQWWKQAVSGFEHGDTDPYLGGEPWVVEVMGATVAVRSSGIASCRLTITTRPRLAGALNVYCKSRTDSASRPRALLRRRYSDVAGACAGGVPSAAPDAAAAPRLADGAPVDGSHAGADVPFSLATTSAPEPALGVSPDGTTRRSDPLATVSGHGAGRPG